MFDTLVLSGGGIKGITFLGCYKYLIEHNLQPYIKTYIGSSVGSICSLLFCIDYTYDELYSIFTEIDLSKFIDYNIADIFSKLGINDGNELIRLLRVIIKQKLGVMDITFLDLYKITTKRLVITGSNISTNQDTCFDYIQSPNMSVIEAVRISISFALFFTPVEYNNEIYVDGALFNPYPIEYSTNIKRTLGLLLIDKYKLSTSKTDIGNYMWCILCGFYKRLINLQLEKYIDNTVLISPNDNIFVMDFNIDNSIKQVYIDTGYECITKYMDNYYQQKRNKHLLWKYFNLLIRR
jgi:predicted patatin/cPLA2 family phospholipase